jgi:hypothetical protein
MIIDIGFGFCRAVIQSLGTEHADLPLLYSVDRGDVPLAVESVKELSV